MQEAFGSLRAPAPDADPTYGETNSPDVQDVLAHNRQASEAGLVAVAGGSGSRDGGRSYAMVNQADAPSCMDCGTIMIRNGACYKCANCGSTSGCS